MGKHKKRKHHILAICLLVLFCTGCQGYYGKPGGTPVIPEITPSNTPASSGVEGGEVSFAVSGFDTWDPHFTDSEDIRYLMSLVYDSLVTLSFDQSVQPSLAVEWNTPDGGLSWLVKLRQGVVWQDGSAFTAEDVKAAADRLMGSEQPSLYSANFKNVLGCDVEAEDTVCFVLEKEDPWFPVKMVFPVVKSGSFSTIGEKPMGTGQYRFAQEENGQASFTKNESYWGEKPFLETVRILKCNSEEAKMQSGADVYFYHDEKVTLPSVRESYRPIAYQGRNFTYLMPNLTMRNSKELRHAVNDLLDRRIVIRDSLAGYGVACNFPFISGLYASEDVSTPYHDPSRGEEYLNSAGYTKSAEDKRWYEAGNTNVLTIKCLVPSFDAKLRMTAQMLQLELAGAGILFVPEYCSSDVLATRLSKGEYEWVLLECTVGSWLNLETMFGEGGELNYNHYSSNELSEQLAQYEKANKKEQDIILQRISSILQEDLPIVGLYIKNEFIMVSSELRGVPETFRVWDPLAELKKWYRE